MFGIGTWIAEHAVLGPLWRMLKAIPWWAYVAAVVLFIGWRVHSGMEDRAFNAAYNAGFTLQQKRIDQWKAASAINLKSIATLQRDLADMVKQSEARGAALVASQQESASEQKRLAALAKADRSRVDALDALAAQHKPDANCAAPAALLAQIKGL